MKDRKNQVPPPSWCYSRAEEKVQSQGLLSREVGNLALDECSVFSSFASCFLLKGAAVLEVGGALPASLVLKEGVQKWISVDPLLQADLVEENYQKIPLPLAELDLPPKSVDVVFSCNAMHHISPLREAFKKIFCLLKPAGSAYLHFGPIWSAPDGHHLEIAHGGLIYRFDGISIIPRWYHLAFTQEELRSILLTRLEDSLVDKIITYVYQSPWLNRHFFEDYLRFAEEAGFFLSHLDTCGQIDYEEYPVQYPSPLVEELKREGLFERIGRFHGKDKRNFYCRDILMIITRPPYHL